MRRVAQVIALPSAHVDRYEELHSAVWPGVLERLRDCHVENYSIYRYGELLFSYLEYTGEDYEADTASIAADPVTREWWDLCGPLQRPVADRREGEWWHDLPEIFHLD